MRLLLLPLIFACRPDKGDDAPPQSTPTDTEAPDAGDAGDGGDTGDAGDAGPYEEIFEDLRTAIHRDLIGSNASGAQVAIWYQGEVIFSDSVGSRRKGSDEAIDADTLFQIGSDTKKLTAIALLQQVERGAISLDDTLAEALPDLTLAGEPDATAAITVHHLLSHQSDLFDYTPWTSAPDDAELEAITLGRFAENEFSYAPGGSYWNYSNPNFSLAGLLVERLEGRPFADVLDEDLFPALGLRRSFSRLEDVIADGDYATGTGLLFPSGYDSFSPFAEPDYEFGTVETEDQIESAFIRPAGLVWSTAEDMLAVAVFLMHGDEAVLSQETLDRLTASQVPFYPTWPHQGYGYGLMVMDGFNLESGWIDTPLWVHGGNTMTMTSTFYMLPEQDFAISILSNGYGDNFERALLEALSSIPALPAPTTMPSFEEAEDLSEYEGTWVDPNLLGELSFRFDGDGLRVSAPALEEAGHTVGVYLKPVFNDVFTLKIDGFDYDVTFIDGVDGEPHQYLRNRQFGAVRADAPAAVRPRFAWSPLPAPPPLPLLALPQRDR